MPTCRGGVTTHPPFVPSLELQSRAQGNVQFWEERLLRERQVRFVVCDPRAPTSKSSRSSPATSPPTEAIPLSETSCAAARTHARPAHTNASPREPQPSSEQCSKSASRLCCPRGHPQPAAKT